MDINITGTNVGTNKTPLEQSVELETTNTASSPLFTPLGQNQILREEAEEVRLKREEASFAQFTKAFNANAAKNNLVFQGINALTKASRDYANDPNFEITDDGAMNVLKQNELPIQYYGKIRNAKSTAQLIDEIYDAKKEVQLDKEIDETLTNKGRITSTVTGAVVDADILVGGVIGGMYSKSTSMAKIMALEGTAEAFLSTSRLAVMDNYSYEDAAYDALLGVGIATGAATFVRAFKKDIPPLPSEEVTPLALPLPSTYRTVTVDGKVQFHKEGTLPMIENKGLNEYMQNQDKILQESIQAKRMMWLDEYRAKQSASDKELAELNAKIEQVEKDFPIEVERSKDIQKQYDDLAEMRAKAADYRYKLNEEIELKKMQDRLDAEAEIIAEQERYMRNKELAERFLDPKYEKYNANRRLFYSKQDELEDELAQGKRSFDTKKAMDDIDSAKIEYAKHSDALGDLRKNGGTKSQIDYRTRKMNEAKAKQAEAQKRLDDIYGKNDITPERARLLAMVDEIAKDMDNAVEELNAIAKGATKEQAQELKELADELAKQFPDEFTEIKNMISSKAGNKDFIKKALTAKELFKNSKLSKKQMGAVLGTAFLMGTSVQADDGGVEEYVLPAFVIGAMIMAFGGANILKQIKNNATREAFTDIGRKFKNSVDTAYNNTSPEASRVKRIANTIADMVTTSFTTTLAPFYKEGGRALDIAKKLVYDVKTGSGAEVMKRLWSEELMANYSVAEKKYFKAWKTENNLGENVSDAELKYKFNQLVTDHKEFRNSTDPNIRAMVEETDKLLEQQYARAKAYGVYGFENFKYINNMVPRLWRTSDMKDIVKAFDDAGRKEELLGIFSRALVKSGMKDAEALTKAKGLLKWFRDSSLDNARQASRDDIFTSLQPLFKEDVEFEQFADALNVTADKNARAKGRIKLDMSKLEEELLGTKITVRGKEVELTLDNLVVRDMKTIIDRTGNALNGSSAIARSGNWKTVEQLNKEITIIEKTNPHLAEDLHKMRDLVLGVPIKPDDERMHEISMIMKDVTIIAKLPLVLLSLPYEAILVLSNGGFMRGLRHSIAGIKAAFGKDSELMQQISMRGSGRGMDMMDLSGTYHSSVDDIHDITALTQTRINIRRVRDASLILNRLVPTTDLFQRISKANNTEQFALLVDGKNDLIKARAKQFGITDKDIEMFKGFFEYNEKGNLKRIDYEKMSSKQADRLDEIVFHMGQNQSIVDTIGASPLAGKTSALGRLITTLIGYPLQQFNIHGVNSMRYLDKTSLMQSVAAFAGTYIGLTMRYEILGKEYNEDDIMTYALLSVPSLGALAALKSIANPAVFSVYGDILSVLGVDSRK